MMGGMNPMGNMRMGMGPMGGMPGMPAGQMSAQGVWEVQLEELAWAA